MRPFHGVYEFISVVDGGVDDHHEYEEALWRGGQRRWGCPSRDENSELHSVDVPSTVVFPLFRDIGKSTVINDIPICGFRVNRLVLFSNRPRVS